MASPNAEIVVEDTLVPLTVKGELSVTELPRATEPPPVKPSPAVTVREELVRSVFATEAHEAAPSAERERGNWFVQDVPAYSSVSPPAPVITIAEVREEKVGAKVNTKKTTS